MLLDPFDCSAAGTCGAGAVRTYPKGPCTQIEILRPESRPYVSTLGSKSKYTHMDTWALRDMSSAKPWSAHGRSQGSGL